MWRRRWRSCRGWRGEVEEACKSLEAVESVASRVAVAAQILEEAAEVDEERGQKAEAAPSPSI
jgi:hypothetical protein